MVALPNGSGLFVNQNPVHYITNAYYQPIGYGQTGSYGMTATRCYYFPLSIWEVHTFQGASIVNVGAADNGKRIRLMVFNDNAATGGPGTLAKDFGQITLTGATAARLLSSSWAATPGNYWGAVWCESACTLTGMAPYELSGTSTPSSASVGPNPTHFIGDFTTPQNFAQFQYAFGHYVNTAYGAAPASAVAPTASWIGSADTATGVGAIPSFWLLA